MENEESRMWEGKSFLKFRSISLTNVLEFEAIKDKAGVVETVVNPYLQRFLHVGKKKTRPSFT